MQTPPLHTCKACGFRYSSECERCPRCHIPREGDLARKWPAIRAYLFFLIVCFIGGIIAFYEAAKH
ncbi:MAG TPA: hypothetical protein VKV29_14095 [Chthonomonas sp.]|jgi:uncharacterized paraquat-inducible protein A|uniref:hypothetical protein n=1 Tax=Chthonomonas sp. TaxID=2282153 RepID=UPI002B4B38F7|nr:hypothetical protein [Chthonomonas sp.]HLH81399.1 hypothetical protein [Chthonomonas sp.]